MGDVVSLVERASETMDGAKAEAMARKMAKGTFDLEDMGEQLKQMQKIGGMSGVLGFLPGMGGIKKKLEGANLDDSMLKRQGAIISSMTPKERRNPLILKASRKRRIAAGSGTTPQEINQLLKMHRQMADMMKSLGKGKGGGLAKMFGMGGGMGGMMGGGMPAGMTPEMIAAAKAGKLPGMPGGMSAPGGDDRAKPVREALPSPSPVAKGKTQPVVDQAAKPSGGGIFGAMKGLPGLTSGYRGGGLPGLPGGGKGPGLPGLPGKKK